MTLQSRIARMEAQIARAKAQLADDEPEVLLKRQGPVCARCAADLVDGACTECGAPVIRTASDGRLLPPLSEMAVQVHHANAKWWKDLETGAPLNRNVGELLMLTVSELAEAMEGHRKNLADDKLPHRSMIEVELADAVIRLLDICGGLHLPVEDLEIRPEALSANVAENLLAITCVLTHAYQTYLFEPNNRIGFTYYIEEAIQTIEMLAEHLQLDVWAAYEEKMAYNSVRFDHSVEGRKLAEGKKY